MLGCGMLGAICYHHGGKQAQGFYRDESFMIIFKFLKEMDEASRAPKQNTVSSAAYGPSSRNHFRNASFPAEHRWRRPTEPERAPLLRQRSLGPDLEEEGVTSTSERNVAGGTVLGIHNLAIVMPQFIVSRTWKLLSGYDDVFCEGCNCSKCYFQDR